MYKNYYESFQWNITGESADCCWTRETAEASATVFNGGLSK